MLTTSSRPRSRDLWGPLILTTILLAVAPGVHAQTLELCSLVDGSGSIAPGDFTIQLEGLASAIEDGGIVPQDSTITASVVQFSSSATVEVAPTLIDGQTTADNIAAQIRAITQIGAGTRIDLGIDSCTAQFNAGADRQTIDLSTDGASTGDPVAAADAAVTAGVDVINALGVGAGVDQSQLEAIVRPQPASQIPEDGFVLLVEDFDEFSDAIAQKLFAEVGGGGARVAEVPTLTTWMLLLLALGLGVLGLRQLR